MQEMRGVFLFHNTMLIWLRRLMKRKTNCIWQTLKTVLLLVHLFWRAMYCACSSVCSPINSCYSCPKDCVLVTVFSNLLCLTISDSVFVIALKCLCDPGFPCLYSSSACTGKVVSDKPGNWLDVIRSQQVLLYVNPLFYCIPCLSWT